MKKWWPWILVGIFAVWLLSALRPPPPRNGFDLVAFGRLPVLLDGRVQPFDSVARNSLLTMQGRQTVRVEGGKSLSPLEWLVDVMMKPDEADKYKVFRVQHPDTQSLLGERGNGLEYYSFNDLKPHVAEIEKELNPIFDREQRKESAPELRTPFQKDLIHLYESVVRYHKLRNTLRPYDSDDYAAELALYEKAIGPGKIALQRSEAKQDYNQQDLQRIVSMFNRYKEVSQYAMALVVPPLTSDNARDKWTNVGASLMDSLKTGEVHPAIKAFAALIGGYRDGNSVTFNQAVSAYRQWLLDKGFAKEVRKGENEFLFNQMNLFYNGMVIYVTALLLGCFSWLNLSENLRVSAFRLLCLGFVAHTVGLVFRMALEGRPPVTNLYSSAIFVGWGAAFLCIILERVYKDGIGTVAAGMIGFSTLIIAHHLALSGDTMEMLRAVLDTNFWLATHVVAVTTGYAATFVSGFLAVIYIFRGVFTRTLDQQTAKSLTRMVYGIVCFATLFSFVGTVLGGIWADQSWGRFWGWDPKENGALLIVLWNAMILHARWGGFIRERGLMAMAVFGNIVTSLSWFGVNMLGVGLHSYGFMDQAFPWLMGFIVSQLAIIGLALMPLHKWASFRAPAGPPSAPTATPPPDKTDSTKGKLAVV